MADMEIFDDVREKYVQFDTDTEVLIRHIDAEKLRKIRAKGQKQANLTGGNAGDIINLLIGKEGCQGWRKIADHNHPGLILNKVPAPFSDANRNLFMTKSLKFSNFINENCIDSALFAEQEAARDEELEQTKND